MRRPEHAERHFAAKVRCFNAGYEKMAADDYDIIGNLDADITFETDYFEFSAVQVCRRIRGWGWRGRPSSRARSTTTIGSPASSTSRARVSSSGGECFEEIGGYVPVAGAAASTGSP